MSGHSKERNSTFSICMNDFVYIGAFIIQDLKQSEHCTAKEQTY